MQAIATDLTMSLPDDRPGTLAQALGAIAAAGINVEGFAEVDGTLHVLAADPAAARRALEAAAVRITGEYPVAVVPLEERPGSAVAVLQKIADARVNVRFAYLAGHNRLVIGASDMAKVAEIVA